MTNSNSFTKEETDSLRSFFIHLLVYSLVNTGLIIINLNTSPESFWAIHGIYGWGIGLFFHAVNTPKLRQATLGR